MAGLALRAYVAVLLFSLVVLPSSALNELKVALLAAGLVFLVPALARRAFPRRELALVGGFAVFFACWYVVALASGSSRPDVVARAFFSYSSCLYVFYLLFTLYRAYPDLKRFSLRLIVGFAFWYCALKLAVILLILVGVVDVAAFSRWLGEFAPSMIRHLYQWGVNFLRLQAGNDLICLFVAVLLPTLSRDLELSKRYRNLLYLVVGLSLLLTLTRFYWLVLAAAVVLYALFLGRPERRLSRWIGLFFGAAALLAVALYAVDQTGLSAYFTGRLNDTASLEVKDEQTSILVDATRDSPWLGKGMGAYVEGYLRNTELPFIYENQIASLYFQFGWLGCGFLVVVFGSWLFRIGPDLTRAAWEKRRIYHFALAAAFLLSGWFNPYLFTLNSAVIYFVFSALSEDRLART